MDPRLVPGPHGLILTRDARDLGLDAALRAARRAGEIERVRPGAYRVVSDRPARFPSQRHAQLVRAAAVTLERPIFTSYSAAAVLGLPIIGRWPDDVVLLGATRNGHRRRGVVEVSRIGEPAIVEVGGILMTSIEYTLIQLCRAAPVADALAAVDAALRAPRHPKDRPALTTIERLRAEHERMLPYRGSRRTEAVLERATDRCDSVLETASRLLFERHGFAEPELQHSLYLDELGITAQVDFFWRDVEAGAEADGRGKYRRADIAESAETVIAEKDRENALRRRLRAFDRWDWRDCRAETPVVRRLDAMGVPRTRRPRSLG